MGLFDRWFSKNNTAQESRTNDNSRKALDLIKEGNALEDAGDLAQALQRYGSAIDLVPGFARGHLNRGNALLACGELDDALRALTTAVHLDPNYAGAHFNLGNVYVRLGQLDAACMAYNQAIALQSDFVDAEVALGVVLDDLGRLEEACLHYRRAIAIQPGYAQVYSNLGKSLKELGQFEAAAASYRRALEIDPSYPEGYNNLGGIFQNLGQLQDAQACYRRALELKPDFLDAHSNLLFLMNYGDCDKNAPSLTLALEYGELVAQRAVRFVHDAGSALPERCLRVGFVSGDFREHPVSYFFESVLSALAKDTAGRLQCFAYCNHVQDDRITQSLRALFHTWRLTTGLSDTALAQQIHNDAIDILVDLSGHTAHTRLPVFAFKPAPLQVSWLGYFGTTGVQAIDYLLADPWTLPASEEQNFTEKIWRLPDTRLCFTPPPMEVEVTELPALENGYFTFGCFNNLTKMTGEVVAVWARILGTMPNSRLFLKSPQLREFSVRQRVAEQFAALGIDPARLVLEGISPRIEYLATYQRIDIALDPFPYTGGTTTMEALWMGVPVLTLQGDGFLSRQGVGIAMNVGLADWVASNLDDYVARAKAHTADLQALNALRSELRARLLASPMCDAPRFAQHFEAALRDMWQAWCSQQEPRLT